MLSRKLVLALCGLAVGAAWAQTTRPASRRYVGMITGTDVYVRSAPAEGYPCMKLSRPARVKVLGEVFGWLKIEPPPGSYSVISKDYVQVDGKTGTVTAADVLVRAGSSLFPSRMDVVQGKLSTGQKVTIVGQQEGYYRIVPPRGVSLWVSSQYVRAAPAGVAPPVATTAPTATAPVRRPTTRRVVIKRPKEEVSKELAAFEAAEVALAKEFDKPRAERDIKALLARYEGIGVAADNPLAPYVQARIKFLQTELELNEDVKAVAALTAAMDARRAKLLAESGRMEIPTTRPARRYAAEGVLAASELFPGGATGPRRFIVTEPHSRLISAYVQCTTGVVDLKEFVGACVGVVGTRKYDEQLRMFVVEAEQVVVLRSAPGGTGKPTLVVPPAPAPAPEVPKAEPPPAPKPEPQTQPATAPATAPATGGGGEATTAPRPAGLRVVEPATRPAPKINVEEYE